jgi:NAD-reducing hydrogenase small subunit
MEKIKLATDWLEDCAGCHMSLLDIDERIVELLEHVELTSSPITDLKHPPESGVDVGILTGAVGTSHHEEVAKEMRERAKLLVALGDCAVFGGICTMRNCYTREALLQRGYVDTESTVDGKVPNADELGKLHERVMAVDEVVPVDVYLPGCPPSADAIWHVLSELLAGRKPVLSGDNLKYE